MNFSLLLTLVFLILIFIEISFNKVLSNKSYRIGIVLITASLLLGYEIYNKKNKEHFIDLDQNNDFEISLDDKYNFLDVGQNFEKIEPKIETILNPIFSVNNGLSPAVLDNNLYIFSNKLFDNSRIISKKKINSKEKKSLLYIGDNLKTQEAQFKFYNNKYGAGFCHFKKYTHMPIAESNSIYGKSCKEINCDSLLNDDSKFTNYLSIDLFKRGKKIEKEFEKKSITECIDGGCYSTKQLIFLAGGYDKINENNFSDTIDIWDYNKNIWYDIKFPSGEFKYNVKTVVLNDLICFIGGIGYNPITKKLYYSNKVEIYDNSKGKYNIMESWRVEELKYGLVNPECTTYNDKIVICSGFNQNGYINTLAIFDPTKKDNTKFSYVNLNQEMILRKTNYEEI